ncbi:MAG: sulfite exporter TauE/SafE family protein [Methanotrichaceae archaeon]
MEPYITGIAILILTGTAVGFASGLLGVGGCFIMIPVQIWVFTSLGVPLDIAVKQAFGTNLLVVLPTAMSGAWGHSKRNVVLWQAGITLGVVGAMGAVIGATIAAQLPGAMLKVVFGVAILLGGVRMLTAKPVKVEEDPVDNPLILAAWALPMGIVTGIIGIGGGILMIPVMVLALKFKIHNAVGTSTAMMIFTTIGGVVGYVLNGLQVPDLPIYSIGYVNLAAFVALAMTSTPMALIGVRAAHRLPAAKLRNVFILVMFYVALKMIGVFSWLGLPI